METDSKKISVLLIDDEQDAIHLLEMFLRSFAEVEVAGSATSSVKGLELALEMLPELIFLDIDMPDMNGLQVGEKIRAENLYSQIVYTTAFEHYAYDTLLVKPLDFLTKPFTINDLEMVIRKFKDQNEKIKQERKIDLFIQSQSGSTKIKLPAAEGILLVEIKDIVIIRSKANKCTLQLADGTTEVINKNLNVLVKMLNSSAFFQTNRSTYINLNYMQRLDKKNSKCIMRINQTTIEESISRIQLAHFYKLNIFPTIIG